MTTGELRVPLRVTWQLAGDNLHRTGEDLRALGILAVDLLEDSAALPDATARLVAQLADGRRAVSLTVRPAALGTRALDALRPLPGLEVLVDARSMDEAATLGDAVGRGLGGP